MKEGGVRAWLQRIKDALREKRYMTIDRDESDGESERG